MRRFLLSMTVGVAFALTIFSVWISCRFWQTNDIGGGSSAAGLFSFSYRHDQCFSLRALQRSEWGNLIQFTVASKVARTMGVVATALGGLSTLWTITGSCMMSFFTVPKQRWRRILAASLWGAAICQSLTFLILIQAWDEDTCGTEEQECTLGLGGLCSIAASVLYFVAGSGVTVLALQPPKENPGTTFLARLGLQLMRRLGVSWKPHPLRSIRWQDIAMLVYAALITDLSGAVLFDCQFFTVNFANNTREYQEGLFRYYYYPTDICLGFDQGSLQSFTPQTKAGRAFAVIAFVLGGFLAVTFTSMIFVFQYPPLVYSVLPGVAFLAALCQSLVFLVVTETYDVLCREDIEDQSCELGPDAYLAIINTILYLIAVAGFVWYSKNRSSNIPSSEAIEAEEAGSVPEGPSDDGLTKTFPPSEVDTESGAHMMSDPNRTSVRTSRIISGEAPKMD